jgi:hypothetical protein
MQPRSGPIHDLAEGRAQHRDARVETPAVAEDNLVAGLEVELYAVIIDQFQVQRRPERTLLYRNAPDSLRDLAGAATWRIRRPDAVACDVERELRVTSSAVS